MTDQGTCRAQCAGAFENCPELAALGRYDLRFLKRSFSFTKHIDVGQCEMLVEEFRKFIALVVLGDAPVPMFSRDVDEVWHSFILHTRAYDDFCHAILGRFLHHDPAAEPTADAPPHGSPRTTLADFAARYEAQFGSMPSVWLPLCP